MIILKQNTPVVVGVVLFASGTANELTGVTGATVVIRSWSASPSPGGTETLLVNGGSGFTWTEVDSAGMPGLYSLSLPASYLPNEGDFVLYVSAPGSSIEKREFFVTANTFDDIQASTTRALGLLHENSVLDLTSFDINNNLLSARLRLYSSAANAIAAQAASPGAYATGQIAQYAIAATYTGKNLQTYLVDRVS